MNDRNNCTNLSHHGKPAPDGRAGGQARQDRLRQMAQTDLRNVNRKELVDINEVEIRKDLSQRERMVDFISQIKNPYCYLDKGMVVKISFAGENRLEDTLKKCARTHRR